MSSLAGLIARADLAIGAGGSTTWERACLGLPSAVVSFGGDQAPISKALHARGSIHLIGKADEIESSDIEDAVLDCLTNLSSMETGYELIDGFGCQRLATALLEIEGSIRLRLVEERDEALLFRWAIDTSERTKSSSVESISEDSHREWFRDGLGSCERLQDRKSVV